jgi:hypothetical protein
MRLLRHLSFSNVIALIALFVALGGAAYAGTKLNGKNIVNASIGGGKLKNETITANKIKKGTITGDQIAANSISSSSINLTTLGTVPSATNAQTAQTATSATTAQSATTATNATKADSATSATTATEAANAKHADEADTASHATTAGAAESLEGTTAEELTLSCTGTASPTEFYGGMCWDKTPRPAKIWLVAVSVCGDEGGRLPSIGELIAYVRQEGVQFALAAWSEDVADVNGAEETVLTSDENERGKKLGSGVAGYRCVFPLTN